MPSGNSVGLVRLFVPTLETRADKQMQSEEFMIIELEIRLTKKDYFRGERHKHAFDRK